MRVNPFNFQKGDVVKKTYTDKITTPYVGVVNAIIPSTNKVEVMWPHGMGMEDPWDLIKVNPLIHPPVVNEDKAYKTFQNELSHKYFEKIQPHGVIKQYLEDKLQPVLHRAASFYNDKLNKSEAFRRLSSEFEHKQVVSEALDRIYNDEYALLVPYTNHDVYLCGNSDRGFKVSFCTGEDRKDVYYDNIQDAITTFDRFKEIAANLSGDSGESNKKHIASACEILRKARKEA
jgi:hypothetical protein